MSGSSPAVVPVESASWKVSLMLLACIMTAAATLHSLLQGPGWWFLALFTCLVVLGAAAAVRALTTRRVLPPLAAVLAFSILLTQQFASETTVLGLVPTTETWARFWELTLLGQRSIQEQGIPADATPGILFFSSCGIGLIALLSDLLAITFRRRALVGIPLLIVLWIPVFTRERDFDPLWVIATAGCYLGLLRVGSAIPHRRLSIAIGSGAVVAALLGQVILPPAVPLAVGGANTSIATGASPVVNLGNNLRRDIERTALTYSTESGRSTYLRLVSLDQFDGEKWFEGEVSLVPENTPQTFPTPPGLSEGIARTEESTWVTVVNLDTVWLPLPYPTRSVVGLGPGWSWDPNSLSLRSATTALIGTEYRATSLVLDPTPEQLLAAGSVVPPELGSLTTIEQEGEGEVPPIIAETAAAVVGDAESNYEKALALQQYLRLGEFVYSEEAPVDEGYDGTGLDVIGTFLQVKSGYCVHFASAMALMARTLGIPSRVAVGFLPGDMIEARDNGRVVFQATSHDLHAWPELYFDGVGWLPFEPTTGRGIVPNYADSDSAGVPAPPVGGENPNPAPTDGAAGELPADLDGESATGGNSEEEEGSSGAWWLVFLAVGLLLLSSVPAVIRWSERRSRIQVISRGFAPASIAWQEILQSAEDVGTLVPATLTPRVGGDVLVSAVGSAPGATEAVDAINRVVAALEREGFGRPGKIVGVTAEDVTTAVAGLVNAVGWWEKLRAALLPISLWRRLSRALRQIDAG